MLVDWLRRLPKLRRISGRLEEERSLDSIGLLPNPTGCFRGGIVAERSGPGTPCRGTVYGPAAGAPP